MIPLTLQTITEATGGRLSQPSAGHVTVTAISDNSKAVVPGSLFLALRGERFDAHDFLSDVVAAGAAALLVHDAAKLVGLNAPAIIVDDTRRALGRLGAFVRAHLSSRIVAVGGSNGKTTTKHLVGSVLSAHLKGSQSPKSFNNDIGVPLTILGASTSDHYVVLELGTNHPGELSPLSLIARPDIAVITSIGPEHLEGFGDLDGVRREEAALLDGLAPHGLAIVNGDDKPLLKLIRGRVPRLVTFGFDGDNELAIASVECTLEEVRFIIRDGETEFCLPMPGRHNASNALAAIAVGREFGLDDASIRHALATCSRPEMRMQLTRWRNITILNDAYNANPASMEAALLTIAEAHVPGRRIAVLGEMREMGASSELMHRHIGQLAATSKIDLLVCVGEAARPLADAAILAGMPQGRIHLVPDSQAAAEFLPPILVDGDTVLLKGSRGVKLERVTEPLMKTS